MPCDKPYTSKDKWIVAFVAALIFMLIASPFLYNVTNKVTLMFGLRIADDGGCPLLSGLIVHGVLFLLIVRLLLR